MKNKFYNVLLALVLCMGAFLMPVQVYAQGGPDTEAEDVPQTASASTDPEAEREPVPFTPGGQATVVDEATGEDGKLFYTFSTPEGNVFYLVIDSQREEDNVYFLNAVTEQDLLALVAEDEDDSPGESAIPETKVCVCRERCREGWADVSCPACMEDPGSCRGKEEEAQAPEEWEDGEEQKAAGETGGGSAGTLVMILLAAAAVGGAGYYLKIYKPKHDLDDAEDLEELLEDGPELNEDQTDGDGADCDRTGRDGAWNQEAVDCEPETGEAAASGENTVLYDDYPEDDSPGGPDAETWEG